MNFFKLYIGDYLRDTGTLTLSQHGAYMLMLMQHYATEKPLPTGKDLHRLLRAGSKSERDAVDFVASKFWRVEDGQLTNVRSEKELARASEVSDTNREIALAREAEKRARAGHEQSTNRAQSVPRTEHERSTYQTPDTRHQNQERATAVDPPPTLALCEPEGPKPTQAGIVCKAMRMAGLQAANPGDPRLLALLEQGATEAEFVGIAAEAAAGGKGWAWVLHVLAARRNDAAAISLAGKVSETVPRRSFEETARMLSEDRARDKELASPEQRAAVAAKIAEARARLVRTA